MVFGAQLGAPPAYQEALCALSRGPCVRDRRHVVSWHGTDDQAGRHQGFLRPTCGEPTNIWSNLKKGAPRHIPTHIQRSPLRCPRSLFPRTPEEFDLQGVTDPNRLQALGSRDSRDVEAEVGAVLWPGGLHPSHGLLSHSERVSGGDERLREG